MKTIFLMLQKIIFRHNQFNLLKFYINYKDITAVNTTVILCK